MLEWYKAIILSIQFPSTAKIDDSFPGVVVRLNNKESSIKYLPDNGLVLLIAALNDGTLFWTRYRYTPLTYGPFTYPAWISFIVAGKYVPINTFLCII